MRRRELDRRRIELAYFDVVAPLLWSSAAGGIERSVDELTDAELIEFIDAGAAGAVCLLKRQSDLPRAQAVAAELGVES